MGVKMSGMEITTDGEPRELLMLVELPESERKGFDYVTEEEAYDYRFIRLDNGSYVDTYEFEVILTPQMLSRPPAFGHYTHDPELAKWDGVMTMSVGDAYVIRRDPQDGDTGWAVLGHATW